MKFEIYIMSIQNDVLAKLLASENINVVREAAKTASFDVVNRTVSIPNWQDITPEIELMLIAHEVGHALYTPLELITEESIAPHSYKNCVEDVRIERKIKSLFPGLRKDFTSGYKQLNDRNFFDILNRDLSKLTLIDRINVYFKCGSMSGVKFTKAEYVFVERCTKTDTFKDVIQLAEEIYLFAKENLEEQKEKLVLKQFEMDSQDEYDEESDEEEDSDEESEYDFDEEYDDLSYEEKESIKSDKKEPDKPEGDDLEKELKSITQESFDKNLERSADTNTIITNHHTHLLNLDYDPIVSYKVVLNELTEYKKQFENQYYCIKTPNIKKFKDDSNSCVNYLVKEFEMKKAASKYSRSMTAKSGSLNLSKIYAHSISDNLFKRVTVTPNDKNHGMIFLLDWSGSMAGVMEDTIKQVINLAMFCQRSSISYQVFAFTSRSSHIHDGENENSITYENFNLLELFTNKMSSSEFNSMIGYLLSDPWRYAPGYGLGSTPLNASLMYMLDYIGKFTKMNNVEKVSLVTLTDGSSNQIYARDVADWRRTEIHKLKDSITKKEYTFTNENLEQTQTLIRVIKDRYNIPVLGFTITDTGKSDLKALLCNGFGYSGEYHNLERDVLADEIKSALRKTSSYIIKHTQYDELYILSRDNKISDDTLKADSKMTAAALSKSFGKFLGKKKTSRVVLEKFIHLIA